MRYEPLTSCGHNCRSQHGKTLKSHSMMVIDCHASQYITVNAVCRYLYY